MAFLVFSGQVFPPITREVSPFKVATQYQLGATLKWSAAMAPVGTALDYWIQPDKNFSDNGYRNFAVDATVDTFKGVAAGGAGLYTSVAVGALATAAGFTIAPIALVGIGIAAGVGYSHLLENTIVKPSNIRSPLKDWVSTDKSVQPIDYSQKWWN